MASFWIGNVLLLALNIPLIGLWVRLLTIPYHILYPAMLFFICVGVYSVNNSTFDVYVALAFGVVGYSLMLYQFPIAPLLSGYILGPLMEQHLRRTLLISRGDPLIFLERPVSAVLIALTAALLLWMVVSLFRKRVVPAGEPVASEPPSLT